jgi:diaminopimelate decarboxylase
MRVVQEIPVRHNLPIPSLKTGNTRISTPSKHPSFQPQLVRKTRGSDSKTPNQNTPSLEYELPAQLSDMLARVTKTPTRVRDSHRLSANYDVVSQHLTGLQSSPTITPAISIKTDPSTDVLKRALIEGWWAEAISVEEVEWAIRTGFPSERIIVNGPLALTLVEGRTKPVAIANCDSVESFERLTATKAASELGVRIRLPNTNSRFGVDVSDYSNFSRVVTLLSELASDQAYAIHFHYPSDTVGLRRWFEMVEEVINWTASIAECCTRQPSTLDIGGGWHYQDFNEVILPWLSRLQSRVVAALPSVKRVILEPGKAITAGTAILVSRVVEVRGAGTTEQMDVVVDARIADLPMSSIYPHPILMVRGQAVIGWLGTGRTRVLGSICMESDILAIRTAFPVTPSTGDLLLFFNAGAYDTSMAWPFGQGVSHDIFAG